MAKLGNRFSQAPGHGGAVRGPIVIVIHSLECDAKENLAWDLANGYIKNEGVSPHTLSDPGETVGVLDTTLIGYHVGPNANGWTNGAEVTGRAAWDRNTWLSGNPRKAIERQAKVLAEMGQAAGFAPGDYRYLSVSEVRGQNTRGYCYHNDISQAVGGTNHWDPGPGYPGDIVMEIIRSYAGVSNYWGSNTSVDPNVSGGSGQAGAETATTFLENLLGR